jgi:hypothetical protein
LHILFVARDHGSERLDLKDAGVGTVEDARKVVEEEIAPDDPSQVVMNAGTLRWVHDKYCQ